MSVSASVSFSDKVFIFQSQPVCHSITKCLCFSQPVCHLVTKCLCFSLSQYALMHHTIPEMTIWCFLIDLLFVSGLVYFSSSSAHLCCLLSGVEYSSDHFSPLVSECHASACVCTPLFACMCVLEMLRKTFNDML